MSFHILTSLTSEEKYRVAEKMQVFQIVILHGYWYQRRWENDFSNLPQHVAYAAHFGTQFWKIK